MRPALFAAALLLCSPALADPAADDYLACLVGKSAVALLQQDGEKDAELALSAAYGQCSEPSFEDDTEISAIDDMAYAAVRAMAEDGLL